MLGSEKMLLTLGVETEKVDNSALKHDDAKVLNIAVAGKWNGETVKDNPEETEKKVGHRPLYVISDNDSKLRKAFRGKGYTRIRDTGHTIAILTEQVYSKDGDFMQYSKHLSEVKIREVMRPARLSVASAYAYRCPVYEFVTDNQPEHENLPEFFKIK